MSLNVENLFVECEDQTKVWEIIEAFWNNSPQPAQPNWGLLSSFVPIQAKEVRRKVAVSPPRGGWLALIESKEVVDFALAKALSQRLATTVLAIQLYESSGAAGYVSAAHGQVLEAQFNEEEPDPLSSTRSVLKRYKVPFSPTLFREAIQRLAEGWTVKQRR